jgi:DNA-binding response OmpR family regulator
MRILVVEDEIKLAQTLKKVLATERYVVEIAFDGSEGYELASTENYDLLILDLNLPGMDGLEICQKLREEGTKTPILMLTARDTLEDRVKGLNLGADDYLVKPFAFEELLARIRSLLRRESNRDQTILTVDDLILDPQAHTIKRGNHNIDLSAKEYALLEYLMRHSGQVVMKQDLLEHVWGGEVDPFSNVIDVYIGYVRGKVDKAYPKKKPLLKTLKGLGYRIG